MGRIHVSQSQATVDAFDTRELLIISVELETTGPVGDVSEKLESLTMKPVIKKYDSLLRLTSK